MTASSAAGKIIKDETHRSQGAGPAACCSDFRNQSGRFFHASDQHPTVELTVNGMHCSSCADRIETVLAALDGVGDASVDLALRKASVQYNPSIVDIEDLKAAVASAGYEIVDRDPSDLKTAPQCCQPPVKILNPHAFLFGALASLAIVGLYLGMNTLTSDWYFARVQFSEYRWWIISLAIGLGIQVTLFARFRVHRRGQKKIAANSSMAASGGVSVVAMMACCAHYLATIIPLLGLSFLSAAAVANLAQYQPYFFLAGIVSCLLGIGFMVRMMRTHGMFAPASQKH